MNSSGSDLLKEHQSTYMHQIQSEYMHQAARRLPLHHASPPRTIFQLILMEGCTLRNIISTSNTNAGVKVPEVMGYADDTGESATDNYLGSTTVHMILVKILTAMVYANDPGLSTVKALTSNGL